MSLRTTPSSWSWLGVDVGHGEVHPRASSAWEETEEKESEWPAVGSGYWEDTPSARGRQEAAGDAHQMVGIRVSMQDPKNTGERGQDGYHRERPWLGTGVLLQLWMLAPEFTCSFACLFLPSFIISKAFPELSFSCDRAPEGFQRTLHLSGGFKSNPTARNIVLCGLYRDRLDHSLSPFNLFVSLDKKQEMTRSRTSSSSGKIINPGLTGISFPQCWCPAKGGTVSTPSEPDGQGTGAQPLCCSPP